MIIEKEREIDRNRDIVGGGKTIKKQNTDSLCEMIPQQQVSFQATNQILMTAHLSFFFNDVDDKDYQPTRSRQGGWVGMTTARFI